MIKINENKSNDINLVHKQINNNDNKKSYKNPMQ